VFRSIKYIAHSAARQAVRCRERPYVTCVLSLAWKTESDKPKNIFREERKYARKKKLFPTIDLQIRYYTFAFAVERTAWDFTLTVFLLLFFFLDKNETNYEFE